jgi:SAM-dependent methyltransferase
VFNAVGVYPMKEFDQAAYWVNRHEKMRGDILSVGNEDFNREGLERSEREFIERLNRALDLIPARSVLDVGCGYGRAAPCFLAHGMAYTGVDVSPVAIDDAKVPGRFIVGDLNTWDTDERFDLVAVLFVFIHFVDDEAWLSLLERCLKWVAPGGYLLLAQRFPRQTERPAIHTKLRSVSDYLHPVAKHGFEFDREFEGRMAVIGKPQFKLAVTSQRPGTMR